LSVRRLFISSLVDAQEIGLRDDPSQGHENANQAAVTQRFPAVKPAESDDEACLGVADDGTAHWAGFVDD
jgi:hypothetical protein